MNDPLTAFKHKNKHIAEVYGRKESVNDNPYIVLAAQPKVVDNPTYEVQPGDSLLKIAYLHNIR